MAIEITIPRLGWNMEEGIFVGWLKTDGETVRAGEPLFSLEGDKATQDIESLEAGILRIPPDGPKDGEKVAVGAVVGYLVGPGEPRRPIHEASRMSPKVSGCRLRQSTAIETRTAPRRLEAKKQTHLTRAHGASPVSWASTLAL